MAYGAAAQQRLCVCVYASGTGAMRSPPGKAGTDMHASNGQWAHQKEAAIQFLGGTWTTAPGGPLAPYRHRIEEDRGRPRKAVITIAGEC